MLKRELKWEKMNQHTAQAVKAIFENIEHLKVAHNNKRSFTIDGRLVGDIGEVIAEDIYNIDLTERQEADYDAICCYGESRQVQIKATFKSTLGFKEAYKDMLYLGIQLQKDGSFKEVYNGEGKFIYDEFYRRRKGLRDGRLIGISIESLSTISNKKQQRILRKK